MSSSRCSTEKWQYRERWLAEEGAHKLSRALNREGKLAEDLYCYSCPDCRRWHLTRQAEWAGIPNLLAYAAPAEGLQRWAMTGEAPGGPLY